MFEVAIDFDDNVALTKQEFQTREELSIFLAKVPSFLGFAINGVANIAIKQKESS